MIPPCFGPGRRGRLLILALLLAAPGLRDVRPGALAQADTIHFEWVETWPDRAPDFPIHALDWPAGHQAGGLDIAPDGSRIAVIDRSDGVVRSFDAAERPGVVLGGPGSGPGQLRSAHDLALLPDGRLVLADTGNDRLQVWSADGRFEREWPVDDPRGLVWVDEPSSQGIYVVARAADGASRVEGYTPEGRLIERFAVAYTSEGENPQRLSPAIEGLAYVKTEPINDGGTLRPVAGFLLAAPEAGQLLMLQGPTVLPQLLLLDRSDPPRLSLPGLSAVASWLAPSEGRRHSFAGAPGLGILPLAGVLPEQADAIPFAELRDLALTPDGRLYATTRPEGLVRVGEAPSLTPRLLGLGRLVGPRRVAAAETLLLADARPRVQRWGLDGGPQATLQLALRGGGSAAALDLAAGGSRAWALSTDAILRQVEAGGLSGFWQAGSRPWMTPLAIDAGGPAALPDGAETSGPALLDLAGQAVILLDADLSETGRIALASPEAPFRDLVDLARVGDQVFVADAENERIEAYGLDGTRRATIPMPGGVLRLAAGPEDSLLALSPQGWARAFAPDGRLRGAWPMDAAGPPRDLSLGADGRLYASGPDDAVRVYARADAAGPGKPPGEAPGCQLTGDKQAAPGEIPLGATITVSLTMRGRCRSEARAADVLLLIDSSGSMGEGRKYVAAKNAAIAFVARMGGADARVAVVDFNSAATLRQRLSPDRAAAAQAIGALVIGGGTNIVGALSAALGALGADPPEPARAGAARAIVMLSDGRSTDAGLDAVLAEIAAAGITVYTIGLGADVDPALLGRIASSPDRAFLSPSIDALQSLYDEIGRRILEPAPLAEQHLVDQLPANMRYLPGSASPIAPEVSPDGRSLSWAIGRLPAEGWDLRYRLEPLQAGLWPTNQAAWLDYVDGLGQAGRFRFPVPQVRVRAPAPGPIYLPLSLRETCPPRPRPNEIVLLIDASNSMLEGAIGGGSKLEAALSAAVGFLDQIALGRDRVALVAFNAEVRVLAGLSTDRAVLTAALGQLRSAPGTRTALGIEAATALLDATRPEAGRILVLLTDGRSSDPEPGAAEASATEARAAGVTVFAIGLGADVDAPALRAIAGAPERYFPAPDATDLAAIYARIAVVLPCPGDALWGRR